MASLRIIFIANTYPSRQQPNTGTFIEQIVNAMARQDACLTVLAPQILAPGRVSWSKKISQTSNTLPVTVFRPLTLSFSNFSIPFIGSTYCWSVWSFLRTVQSLRRCVDPTSNCCYGHFLYPAGLAALNLARFLNVPAIVALGESSLANYERYFSIAKIRDDLSGFAGILTVSEKNKNYCVEHYGIPPKKIVVLPNAVDISLFYPRERSAMRSKLGLPQDLPIVAFVGHFIERKGPLRVMEALKAIPDVKAVFLGAGPQKPMGTQVLFAGPVPQEEIPEWLSAADLFILPTLAEGSCNAILEAMACALPVISSDLSFNHEILDSSSALLVDPCDTISLTHAIFNIISSKQLRENMGTSALDRVRLFTLEDRAKRILAWLETINIIEIN